MHYLFIYLKAVSYLKAISAVSDLRPQPLLLTSPVRETIMPHSCGELEGGKGMSLFTLCGQTVVTEGSAYR